MPKGQLNVPGFRGANVWPIEVLVADNGRIIDPRGIRWRIERRARQAGIRTLPQNTIGIDPIDRRPKRG